MSLRVKILPVTPFQQNASLLWCDVTMKGAFIDPGGDIEKLEDLAKAEKVHIEQLLLTHGHIDHAGAARIFAEQLNVPVIGPHRDDEFWLSNLSEQARAYNFSGVSSFVPDQWLEDGDEISIGNEKLKVLHCPGHTPGHIVFVHRESQLAFVGDVLFKGSIGRTDFPRGNHEQLIRSITQKLWPLGHEFRFVPGHGPMSTFAAERQSNPFVADHLIDQ